MRPSRKKRIDGLSQTQGVKWFDKVSLGPTPSGKKDVCPAIKEKQNRYMGDASTGFLELEIVTDRDSTHVLDLTIGDDQLRSVTGDRCTDLGSGEKLHNLIYTVIKHGAYFVEHRSCIADNYDIGHILRLYQLRLRSQLASPLLVRPEWTGDQEIATNWIGEESDDETTNVNRVSDANHIDVATREPDDRKRLRVGEPTKLLPGVVRLLAPNASLMTGPGTNTYLVGDEDLVVIDPGPEDVVHLERIVAIGGGKIRYVVVTHSHRDHAPGARALGRITGATVLGFDERPGFVPDGRIVEGDILVTDTVRLEAVHTPGHASDHLCFVADSIGRPGVRVLFSGDHIMQGSTVVIGPPDGDMGDYLSSLQRVSAITPPIELIAPGHGMLIDDPHAAIDAYLALRKRREESIHRAILNRSMSAGELVELIYEDLPDELVRHAKRSVWAHLRKLHNERRVTTEDPNDPESIWHRS